MAVAAPREAFHLLFVCSANLCRSVTAAEYARRAIAERSFSPIEWHVDSAGTDVELGQIVPVAVGETMLELGIPPEHQPRQLTEADARAADLILTAERYHRMVVARRFPFAIRRTFTLLQLARLVSAGLAASPSSTVASVQDLYELVNVGRSSVQPYDDDTIDIDDPVVTGSATAMLRCATTIQAAVEQIIV